MVLWIIEDQDGPSFDIEMDSIVDVIRDQLDYYHREHGPGTHVQTGYKTDPDGTRYFEVYNGQQELVDSFTVRPSGEETSDES